MAEAHHEIAIRRNTVAARQSNKNNIPSPLPLSMHVVNIGYLHKRTHFRTKQKCKYQLKAWEQKNQQKKKSHSFTHQTYYPRRSFKNKQRQDQSSFSDFKLKHGINVQREEQKIRSESNEQQIIQTKEIWHLQQNKIKEKYIQLPIALTGTMEMPKFNTQKGEDKRQRKIFSQTERRRMSYFPNIKGMGSKVNDHNKRYNISDFENESKLDGWAFNLPQYELDKKLDITEYANRGDSKGREKPKDYIIKYKKLNQLSVFQ